MCFFPVFSSRQINHRHFKTLSFYFIEIFSFNFLKWNNIQEPVYTSKRNSEMTSHADFHPRIYPTSLERYRPHLKFNRKKARWEVSRSRISTFHCALMRSCKPWKVTLAATTGRETQWAIRAGYGTLKSRAGVEKIFFDRKSWLDITNLFAGVWARSAGESGNRPKPNSRCWRRSRPRRYNAPGDLR